MSDEPPPLTYCSLVLGMQGSGTTAIAEHLVDMGFEVPLESPAPRSEDNADGYFQSREIVYLNNRILVALGSSWQGIDVISDDQFESDEMLEFSIELREYLATALRRSRKLIIKDPRICRLLPLWLPVLEASFDHLAILIVISEAEDVFNSLARRADDIDISGAAITDRGHAYALWFRYNIDALHRCHGIPHHVVNYGRWLEDNKKESSVLHRYLEGSLPGIQLPLRTTHQLANAHQKSSAETGMKSTVQRLAGRISSQDPKVNILELEKVFNIAVPAANQAEVSAPAVDVRAAGLLKHAVGQIEHFPGSETQDPVIYISQDSRTRGHIYRVVNMIDALRRLNIDAFWLSPEAAIESKLIKQARAVIIHRCDRSPAIKQLIRYCQRRKIPVGFDIDDYLFDQEVLDKDYFHYAAALPTDEQQMWRRRISGYQQLITEVDFCITTTTPLKAQLERFNQQVILVPNGFSAENLSLAKHWRREFKGEFKGEFQGKFQNRQGSLRIGYASGTPTHDADFATIAEPVAQFLRENADWSLTMIGSVSLGKFQQLFDPQQIEIRPLTEHINFAYELARLDILLVPLQTSNPFCDAKSPLKWFEAALAGTAAICINNPVFNDAVSDGTSGLLSRSPDEWYKAITMLSRDLTLRNTLTGNAAQVARGKYDNVSCLSDLVDLLSP